MDNQESGQLIDKLWEDGKYRPQAVAVLYRVKKGFWGNKRRFLITKTPKKKATTPWYFPQGGIDFKETLEHGLERELKEELGINLETDLINIRYGFKHQNVLYEKTRKNVRAVILPGGRGVVWEGKGYIFTLAQYVGDGELRLERKEIKKAKWLSYRGVVRKFKKARKEKAELLIKTLNEAIAII